MPIDFHNQKNSTSYSTRNAHSEWIAKINEICDVKGKKILDIGCGGGIYSRALADMGAAFVTGLDFSFEILQVAKEQCKDYSNIDFKLGNALHTAFDSNQYDIILSRAVIHHIDDLHACFHEVHRLLKQNSLCIIQDRTVEDCILDGSPNNIRGYFFSKFPHLASIETARRHSSEKVLQVFEEIGFSSWQAYKLWETRKTYAALDQLVEDLQNRTGRSILHDLNDNQLAELISYIKQELIEHANEAIIESDRWTIWVGKK